MRLDPRDPEYLFQQGRAYSLLGRWKESILALKPYLGRHPDHLWAHAFIANDYSSLGDDDAARAEAAEVERAVALSPNSSIGYAALAQALNNLGKPAEALVAVDKAFRLDPRNRDSYLHAQGLAYTLLGRWQEATTALKPYLALYHDDFWAHARLAVDYMELGHDDDARAEVTEVQRLNPEFSVEIIFPTDSLQRKALPAEIDRFRADLRKAGLK
jgi:tetratricopeptide (TPR) repeat protein